MYRKFFKMVSEASLRESSVVVHILMVVFGMRAWVDLTGIWVEMPILVDSLPEGWTMGSLITICTQLGNVLLVLYIAGNILFPNVIKDTLAIAIIYITGGAACILVIFFWDSTTLIGGSIHSTALLVLTVVMGGLNCLTSVVFVTFVSSFKKQYVASMFVGFGFGSLLPSVAAIIQGVGNTVCLNSSSFDYQENVTDQLTSEPFYLPPRFSLQYFFVFILGLEVVSFASFIALRFSQRCRMEKIQDQSIEVPVLSDKEFVIYDNEVQSKRDVNVLKPETNNQPGRLEFVSLLILMCWLNGLWNGMLRSIQSYVSLPYGTQTFHLGMTLSNSSSPLAGFCALFIPTKSKRTLFSLGVLTTIVFVYVMVLVSLSPSPPLQDHVMGQVLSIFSQVAVFGLVSYVRACVAAICHSRGGRAGMWLGIVLQIGSLIGAAIAYLCVNVLYLFKDAQPCLLTNPTQ